MSKNYAVRIVSLLLVLVMVGTALIACNDNTGNTGTGGNPDIIERPVDDNLPDDLDFKGKTVVFLYGVEDGDPNLSPMSVESITNDALNDAIFNREYSVNDRLNVKLNFIQDEAAGEKARLSIDANLDEYQLVGGNYAEFIGYGKEGLFTNLLDKEYNPYVELNQPWWSDLWVDASQMYGQCYFATGALSLTFTKSITSMYFNKEMVKNAGVENLYKVITDGDWTLDYMLNLIKGSYVDVTGNGKTDDDIYGLVMDDARIIDAFWSAFDLSCLSRDADGNPVFSMNKDKMQSVVDRIRAMQKENKDIFCINSVATEAAGGSVGLKVDKFVVDEAMFTISYIYITEQERLRDMKTSFGIIPLPKWDDAQADYYSFNNAFAVYGIPTTVQNPELASAVLEALAVESYAYVAPTYYNKVLNGQYTRDLESSDMLDLMVNNVKLDFGWVYDTDMKKIAQESLRYFIREETGAFSTYWRRNERRYENAFNDLIDAYKERADELGIDY